jgi:hypothetical protein
MQTLGFAFRESYLQTLRSGLLCRTVHRIQEQQKPTEENACREGNRFHNAKGRHVLVCFGVPQYNVSPDLGPRCKASESVEKIASMTEGEKQQASDFHYLQVLKREQSAKQQARHQHQQIGCVLFHLDEALLRGLK